MSATIESDLFSMYFAVPVRGRVEGAPVITVEGKSFPVVECYLDDLYELTGVSTSTVNFNFLFEFTNALYITKCTRNLLDWPAVSKASKGRPGYIIAHKLKKYH